MHSEEFCFTDPQFVICNVCGELIKPVEQENCTVLLWYGNPGKEICPPCADAGEANEL